VNSHQKIFKILSLIIILIALPFGLYSLDKATHLFSRAFGKKANLLVDTGVSFQAGKKVWKNLAQGGEESTPNTLTPVFAKIASLKPEYIRIDHIYDFYDIAQGSSANLSFNFSKLDIILADIKSMGAKPFISLSYMPKNISRGEIVDFPISWSD